MFGYVFPNKPEMKVKEFTFYKAVYCGLCKKLGEKYGIASRFLLNYDLLLLAILADSLSGEAITFKHQTCIASPVAKKTIANATDGLDLAADCLVLLSYYKMQDNIADDGFVKSNLSKTVAAALKKAYKKASILQPNLDKTINEQMQNQLQLEKENCTDIDRACDPTAQMVANMAVLCDKTQPQLYRFGLFLGKLIYLLDAAEDYEKDKKTSNYNIFVSQCLDKEKMLEYATQQTKLCAAELSASYSSLDFKQNKSVLDNIIYLGLAEVISKIGCPPKRRNTNEPI